MRHTYRETPDRTVVVLANGEEVAARSTGNALALADRIALRDVLYMVPRTVERAQCQLLPK